MDDYICIYLYNLSFEIEGDPPITTVHYVFEPHEYTKISVEKRIKKLVDAIFPHPHLHPSCYGTKFSDLRRRRKGYVAFVVDPPEGTRLKDVKMKYKKFLIGHEEAKHTFQRIDVKEITVDEGTSHQRKMWLGYFFNQMKNDDGEDLMNDSEDHRYQLKFEPEIGVQSTSGLSSYEDSGGTNTGPPVSPPALLI